MQNVTFGAPAFADEYVRLGMAQTPDAYEVLLTRVTQEYEQFASNESLPQALYFPLETSDELAQLTTVIRSFIDESIVRFITGDREINSEWDAFQTELRNLGVDRWLEIYQTAYDAQYR